MPLPALQFVGSHLLDFFDISILAVPQVGPLSSFGLVEAALPQGRLTRLPLIRQEVPAFHLLTQNS